SAYVAVKDLSYFVPNPTGDGELQLLHNVNAYFVPGKMTALMGSSGAGKTTFMDVLAGRKTGGRCEGQILVNGEPKDPLTFSRIAGYCEQMDIHSGGATIREALEFSARLRLPRETTAQAMEEFIHQTMDLLELNGIAKELVRNCSVEQKKRITIGVEVVSNPSILFLDEPTSGLDARSASIVMRGVQQIARTGRTVVCTIHQPSKQIFELFDSLLLLQKGGYMAFLGELGDSSDKLLEYFAGIPGTAPMVPKYNPATYMLEVIGAGIGRGESKDYSLEYTKSALCKHNLELTAAIGGDKFVANADEVKASGAKPLEVVMTPFSTLHLDPVATGFFVQLRCCVMKMMMTYWRNPQYNL
ncbi:Pleiotropic drug resistance protein abc superfamily, partial [Globisporangium polare]